MEHFPIRVHSKPVTLFESGYKPIMHLGVATNQEQHQIVILIQRLY